MGLYSTPAQLTIYYNYIYIRELQKSIAVRGIPQEFDVCRRHLTTEIVDFHTPIRQAIYNT